jgi:hypothetical protein
MGLRKKSLYFSVVLTFVIGVALLGSPTISLADKIQTDLQSMADSINKRLPLEVEPKIELKKVEVGPDKNYSYVFRVDRKLNDLEKKLIQTKVTEQAKANKELNKFFKAGVTAWYKYFDKQGNLVFEYSVSNMSLAAAAAAPLEKITPEQATRIAAIVGAILAGCICGCFPLYLGIRRGRPILACLSLLICTGAGFLLGIILAIPAAVACSATIKGMPSRRLVPIRA